MARPTGKDHDPIEDLILPDEALGTPLEEMVSPEEDLDSLGSPADPPADPPTDPMGEEGTLADGSDVSLDASGGFSGLPGMASSSVFSGGVGAGSPSAFEGDTDDEDEDIFEAEAEETFSSSSLFVEPSKEDLDDEEEEDEDLTPTFVSADLDVDGELDGTSEDGPTRYVGSKADEVIEGGAGSDSVKGKKGDDEIDGADGDDHLRGDHGDDTLDGGRGSDIVDGGKGEDTLVYTMSENSDEADFYDGGKGSDTLVLKLTAEEFETYKSEIEEMETWIAENADAKKSTSHSFSDASAHSAVHPIFETSFGLTIRNFEALEVEILEAEVEPIIEPVIEIEVEPKVIVEPEPATEVKVDLGATTGETVPVEVTLQPDSTITLSVDVDVRELPSKFDVFMVQDLSGSFYDDLPNVKAQFPTLAESLSAEYDAAFGIGSFVDKPIGTFGYAPSGDYAYKTDQSITTDLATASSSMDSLGLYSGYDYPESQLEALVQVALRGEEIGFRDGAQKFVVLSTDAMYHQAGDYAEAGPNDLDTELENEDYPDPADVGALLKAAGIIPIFAVTSYVMADYQALVDSWGFGSVTELASDSSNLQTAITAGLKDASLDLTLDISDDDYGYVSGMTPGVYEDAGPGTYTFDITLELPADAESYGSDSLTITIPGYGDIALDIEIASIDTLGDDAAETLLGDAGPNAIDGAGGDDVLGGEGGNDTLIGGSGDDVLTGGLGDDVFVFENGAGNNTVTDFNAGDSSGDVLDFRRMTSVTTYAEVIAAASQVETDTVFNFDDGETVTLIGVNIDDLNEADVLI